MAATNTPEERTSPVETIEAEPVVADAENAAAPVGGDNAATSNDMEAPAKEEQKDDEAV